LKPEVGILELLGVAATIAAALRTGLLQELSRGRATARELSERVKLDPRATALALDLLACEGLAARDGDAFVAGPVLELLAAGPGGLPMSLGLWAHTEKFLRTGESFMLMDLSPAEREAQYKNVVAGLGVLFEAPARELAAKLPARPARILDVGCGSGVWSLAMAERDPAARVTGLDLPAVVESFRERARSRGLAERIATIPGDMFAAEAPRAAFDLVVIANVLRLEPVERAAALVRRFAGAVAPGGALLVIDALAGGTEARELARAVYALHLGLRTKQGRVHSPGEISRWLADAGLSKIQTIDVADGAGAIGALWGERR
jgi:SAM-dependent methyltransferase